MFKRRVDVRRSANGLAAGGGQEFQGGETLLPQGLLQPRVLGLGLLQDGDVRVCVFPKGEETLIRGAAFGGVPLQSVGAGQAQMCQRPDEFILHEPRMVEDFLELDSRLTASTQS